MKPMPDYDAQAVAAADAALRAGDDEDESHPSASAVFKPPMRCTPAGPPGRPLHLRRPPPGRPARRDRPHHQTHHPRRPRQGPRPDPRLGTRHRRHRPPGRLQRTHHAQLAVLRHRRKRPPPTPRAHPTPTHRRRSRLHPRPRPGLRHPRLPPRRRPAATSTIGSNTTVTDPPTTATSAPPAPAITTYAPTTATTASPSTSTASTPGPPPTNANNRRTRRPTHLTADLDNTPYQQPPLPDPHHQQDQANQNKAKPTGPYTKANQKAFDTLIRKYVQTPSENV